MAGIKQRKTDLKIALENEQDHNDQLREDIRRLNEVLRAKQLVINRLNGQILRHSRRIETLLRALEQAYLPPDGIGYSESEWGSAALSPSPDPRARS